VERINDDDDDDDLHYVECDADGCRHNHSCAVNVVAGVANSLDGKAEQHSSHHPNDENADHRTYHLYTLHTTTTNFLTHGDTKKRAVVTNKFGMTAQRFCRDFELQFYISLNTKKVISETFFPANLLPPTTQHLLIH